MKKDYNIFYCGEGVWKAGAALDLLSEMELLLWFFELGWYRGSFPSPLTGMKGKKIMGMGNNDPAQQRFRLPHGIRINLMGQKYSAVIDWEKNDSEKN